MRTTVMTVVVLTAAGMVPAAPGAGGRNHPGAATALPDKTGTAGGVPAGMTSQTQVSQPLTAAGSLQAEREGFSYPTSPKPAPDEALVHKTLGSNNLRIARRRPFR